MCGFKPNEADRHTEGWRTTPAPLDYVCVCGVSVRRANVFCDNIHKHPVSSSRRGFVRDGTGNGARCSFVPTGFVFFMSQRAEARRRSRIRLEVNRGPNGKPIPQLAAANLQRVVSEECATREGEACVQEGRVMKDDTPCSRRVTSWVFFLSLSASVR